MLFEESNMYRRLTTAILTLSAIATTNIACTAISETNRSDLTPVTQTRSTGMAIEMEKSQTKNQQQVQFICAQSFDKATNRRLPTTFAWTARGKIAIVRWKTEQFPDYPPQKRCQEVSPRFQEAYNSGTLDYITNGKMNNQPVICTTTAYGGTCRTLLMTLRSQDNSLGVLNELRNILNGRTVGPVVHSSGMPQAYYEIDIQYFLENAPVEEPVE
jgi:hypothetical protein